MVTTKVLKNICTCLNPASRDLVVESSFSGALHFLAASAPPFEIELKGLLELVALSDELDTES